MLLRPRQILRRRTIVRISPFAGKRGRPTGSQLTGPEPIAAPRQSTLESRGQVADRRP